MATGTAPVTIRNDVPVDGGTGGSTWPAARRADARRNEQALLDAAAAVFVASGVEAPVRDIAARAGVGVGTVYRHFPTRADLIVAVYRHQVEACAEAGRPAGGVDPYAALARWIDLFVDFLVTKHGLAAALQSDSAGFDALHAYFLDRLVPVCAAAARRRRRRRRDPRRRAGLRAHARRREPLHRRGHDPRYDARRLAGLLVAGLRR